MAEGLGTDLGRVLINAQMSGFGGEAEFLCSTRALPVRRLGYPLADPLLVRLLQWADYYLSVATVSVALRC